MTNQALAGDAPTVAPPITLADALRCALRDPDTVAGRSAMFRALAAASRGATRRFLRSSELTTVVDGCFSERVREDVSRRRHSISDDLFRGLTPALCSAPHTLAELLGLTLAPTNPERPMLRALVRRRLMANGVPVDELTERRITAALLTALRQELAAERAA